MPPEDHDRFTFRPERFFDGRLRGWGVVRTLTGKVRRRYRIEVQGGWADAERAFRLEEIYTFDDGMVDTVRWTMTQDDEGHYVGREERAEGVIRGRWDGPDYRLTLKRPTKAGGGRYVTLKLDVRFSAVDADAAMSFTRVSRWGVPVATLTAFYRRETPAGDGG